MYDTKKYNAVSRRPFKGDLVFIRSQEEVFTVIHADGMLVKVELGHAGSGRTLVAPPSQYILLEEK